MDINDSEKSRRGDLEWCLRLIDMYESDLIRLLETGAGSRSTLSGIRSECETYRRRAHRTFGFPCPGEDRTPPRS